MALGASLAQLLVEALLDRVVDLDLERDGRRCDASAPRLIEIESS